MDKKMILADELTAYTMIAVGWEYDTKQDHLIDREGEVVGWEDYDTLTLNEPITHNGTPYQQINVWGDGTLEFQDSTDCDSYNWNDFSEEFIEQALVQVITMVDGE